jgi:hypothetical protein
MIKNIFIALKIESITLLDVTRDKSKCSWKITQKKIKIDILTNGKIIQP